MNDLKISVKWTTISCSICVGVIVMDLGSVKKSGNIVGGTKIIFRNLKLEITC